MSHTVSWSMKVMWMNNTLFNTPNVTHSVMVIETDVNEQYTFQHAQCHTQCHGHWKWCEWTLHFSTCLMSHTVSWSLKVMWMNNTLQHARCHAQYHGHWKWCQWTIHFSTCPMSHTMSWSLKVMWMNNTLFNMPDVTHSNTFSVCSLSWSLKLMWVNKAAWKLPSCPLSKKDVPLTAIFKKTPPVLQFFCSLFTSLCTHTFSCKSKRDRKRYKQADREKRETEKGRDREREITA